MSVKYTGEPMLNTAEAARFLRVSPASIRRWTDAGILSVRRVGRRRERRFTEADLVAFMDRDAPARPTGSLSVGGVNLPVPAHVAAFYATDAGGQRLSVPFLVEGIRLHQPCYLVAADRVLRNYVEAIAKKGVDVAGAVAAGALHIVRFEAGSTDAAIAQWERYFGAALGKGPTVARVVGEMSSERTMFSSEDEMLKYEEAFEVMSRRYPVAVVCQYDVREFSGVAILRALKAHPDLFDVRIGTFLN